MPRTGHMFGFSHPGAYSLAIRNFLESEGLMGVVRPERRPLDVMPASPPAVQGTR